MNISKNKSKTNLLRQTIIKNKTNSLDEEISI